MRYRTIVADPPWAYPPRWNKARRTTESGGWALRVPTQPAPHRLTYPTMTVDQICQLPVADLVAPDAHLYLWATNNMVEHSWMVARAWGFEGSTLLTWCKAPMGLGLGGQFSITTEFVLFARRGSLRRLSRTNSTWWQWRRTAEHSQKPEHFYDLVEQVSPGPYVELFARHHRLGWDVWGDQSANTAELAV